MSQQRAAAGPGYNRPLSDAQIRALRLIDINGDIRYPSFSSIRTATINVLLREGLVEHCELPVGSGAETRTAIRLTELALAMKRQWRLAAKEKEPTK